jgi:hypothetical protein
VRESGSEKSVDKRTDQSTVRFREF